MVKAIFFDIDGTLVSFKNHQIPKSTFDALYKLKEKGIKLFIATGRGKDGLDVLNDFPFDGYITLNGQYCYTNNQIIYSNTIKKEDLQALLDYLKDHQVPCGFTEENTKYFNYRDERVDAIHAITHNDDHPAGDCSHVIDKHIYQIMCFVDENEDKVKILEQIALNRNCKMKGNELDYEKASKIVLEEFRNGKLGKISLETPEEGTKEA